MNEFHLQRDLAAFIDEVIDVIRWKLIYSKEMIPSGSGICLCHLILGYGSGIDFASGIGFYIVIV